MKVIVVAMLHDYGIEAKMPYARRARRIPREPDMSCPSDLPLSDVTVRAIKVGTPKSNILNAEWTHIACRRQYPNQALIRQSCSLGDGIDRGH
jgi:hypothetical protein